MSGEVIDDLDMGVEYTFEVRALGMCDLKGPPADEGEGADEKGPLKWF